jgi:propionyl-CoA synthetase
VSYLATYPGYHNTSDADYVDGDGYVWVMGRTDDMINVAGYRLSTWTMEEAIASHGAVAECAVIGFRDDLKGEVPCGLVVLKGGVNVPHGEVSDEIVALVRERIGPVAAFRRVIVIERLPKTRSGKILRSTMRKIANGETYVVRATIEDPTVLEVVEQALCAGSEDRDKAR